MSEPVIGLSLSGGGSRAIAFHLGCLRALHDLGILDQVKVVSTVSGGSVIGALYAAKDEPFPAFETKVRALLARGLVRPALRKTITTTEGLRAAYCAVLLGAINLAIVAVAAGPRLIARLLPPAARKNWSLENLRAPLPRFASRTTILRRVFDEDVFHGQKLCDLPARRPLLIINAADLRTGSAFYFSREKSGSWRLGELAGSEATLAHAVTASAAYPLLLPALDERLAFNKPDGSRREEHVTLTDGGAYDNLGLAPLWPDRDASVSLNVSGVDTIICCRAGYGLRFDPPSQFFIARLTSTFACVFDRAQNAGIKRLFDLKAAGRINGFLMPFLGQDDSRLACAPPDLVSREEAHGYPTDFAAMPEEWIEKLSMRGEQLTRAMIAEHMPELKSDSIEASP
ncbi:patatin-like phospholipase family protein [Roseovarius spongiae]|uniref:Patatin-like phospholipase family protein n=1 Tax=Roseovarius spongiae TaxID=2320272 RepID=A0A3A8AQX1_9RHOB|nr:patatin-like phospholipase family protein [Roseovarius spongiae]RKF12235.1 patatin-like phospholipase family protein [Roseovarius spongiae]